MLLHIRHETLYRYDRPVKHSVQSLRLTPRTEAGQSACLPGACTCARCARRSSRTPTAT
jgi:transglutaminase-like putative cysteine protease